MRWSFSVKYLSVRCVLCTHAVRRLRHGTGVISTLPTLLTSLVMLTCDEIDLSCRSHLRLVSRSSLTLTYIKSSKSYIIAQMDHPTRNSRLLAPVIASATSSNQGSARPTITISFRRSQSAVRSCRMRIISNLSE